VLVAWTGWRVGRDLLGAHLLGRAACPVGGGEHEGAQRRDPFSVGLGIGAIGGVLVLLVHSAFDFAARIPANGILGAACLGIATVALHTRFQPTGERLLTVSRVVSLGGSGLALALGSLAIVVSLGAVPWIVRPAPVLARLQAAERPGTDRVTALRWVQAALALDAHDERALALRGRLRLDATVELWNSGVGPDGQVLTSLDERRQAGLILVGEARQDLEAALAQVPSDSRLHDGRARAFWAQALLDPGNATRHLDAALASFSRAVALAPENPFLYWTLAVFAAPQGGHSTEVGLQAAREAIERDPALLADLIDQFLPLRLSGAQWVTMVPRSAIDRAELGAQLEARRLTTAAAQAYRSAIEVAPAGQALPIRWALARLELREQRPREALGAIEAALAQDPDNPELHLVRGEALAALGDAGALTAYRLAVLKADLPGGRPADQPFGVLPPRVQALVSRALPAPAGPARYQRALARYLVGRKLWEQALSEWDAVLAAVPGDAEAHFGRGIVLDALGRGNPALQEYRQAVALDGTRRAFRLRLAQRLWETEQYYQAMNEWRSVLGQEPGNIEARLGLARAAARSGDRAAAAQEYRHILQIAPDQPEARRELARLGRAPSP
jgi:tetratricopeptide (TPR) repeat protein